MLKASLTTTGRLDECINLAVKYITEGNADLEKSSADLKTLFRFATAQTHFCSGPTLFAVKLMVLCGFSPRSSHCKPFMEHQEIICVEQYTDSEVLFYLRCVDDTFCLFQNTLSFSSHFINSRNPSIRFIMKKDVEDKLHFLGITIDNNHPSPFIAEGFIVIRMSLFRSTVGLK